MSGAAPLRILLWVAALAAISLAGFALRATSAVGVLRADGIAFTAPGDSYYHMRRIVYSAARFPEVLSKDPYVNPPEGGEIVWPPAFDLGIAALARGLGAEDAGAVEQVAAWVPPAVAAITVFSAGGIAALAFGPGAGLLAAALLAVLPAHLLRSQMGLVDHHVAVAAFAVWLLGAAGFTLRRDGRGVAAPLVLGGSFAGAILTWPGALIHVLTLQAVLVPWAVLAPERDAALRRVASLALAHGVAALLLFPSSWGVTWTEYGAWSPLVLTSFQPLWFGAAAVGLLVARGVWSLGPAGARPASRAAGAAAIALVGVALAVWAIPGLLDAIAYGAGWFTKDEAFQHDVAELLPYSIRDVWTQFSILGFAFPLVWGWLATRGRASRFDAGERWCVLVYAGAFFLLAMLQRRFGNSLSVIFVLFWAFAGCELRPWLRERLAARGAGPRADAAVAGLLALVVLASLASFHAQRLGEWAAARRDPLAAQRGTLPVRHHLIDRAAVWLGRASPETAGWLDPDARPEYAVLTSWDTGHAVRYRARRAVIADNFGVYGGRENYEAAWRYYESEDEAAAARLLERLNVRYVVADRQGAGTHRPYAPRSMTHRLATTFGSASPAATAASDFVPALGRHRLIHHLKPGNDPSLAGTGSAGGAVGVWERVAGAEVVGQARPGAWVACGLALEVPGGRRHHYVSRVRADPAGRWALRLPYPNDASFSPSVRAARQYRCRSEGRARPLRVVEAAIQAGAVVEGPRFAAGVASPAAP